VGLVRALPGAAARGIGAVGEQLRGARANASAVAGDLMGRRKQNPLAERDPDFIRATLASNRQITDVYFRPKVRGLENIPPEGPVLLVGNHSGGTLIADTFVFAYAFYNHFGPDRLFHQLAHDVAVKLPGVAAMLRKYGTLPASHECAEKALEAGAAVLVYPGGDFESFRPSWHSDQIEFGGRSGFVRLALAQDVPIVPVVAIGGQETALFVTRGQRLARLLMLDRLLRIKVLPIALAPPWGLSFLDLPMRAPLPAQITVEVLPPIDLRERFGAEPDEDEVYDAVTSVMQLALDQLGDERDLPVVGTVWSDRSGDGASAASDGRADGAQAAPGTRARGGGRSQATSANGSQPKDGVEAEHQEEPWEGYADMRVPEISDRLSDESEQALLTVRGYERSHKDRRGVLQAVERELKRR
jgi:1-acyl-sn-glycerol-3-phosphate acyltransferase